MSEMHYRTLEIRPGHYDDKEKRLSLAFVSEEPVRREFGYDVIDQGQMDLSFMESGRAPLLWMHDAEQVLGVVESVELGSDRKSRLKCFFQEVTSRLHIRNHSDNAVLGRFNGFQSSGSPIGIG